LFLALVAVDRTSVFSLNFLLVTEICSMTSDKFDVQGALFFDVPEEQTGLCRILKPDTDGRGKRRKETDMSVKGEIKEGAGLVKGNERAR
jgi:hypothetical protein